MYNQPTKKFVHKIGKPTFQMWIVISCLYVSHQLFICITSVVYMYHISCLYVSHQLFICITFYEKLHKFLRLGVAMVFNLNPLTNSLILLFLIFVTETISRTDEGQPRAKYIFNKCGTNIYFFTLQRFGPSPSPNFKWTICFVFNPRFWVQRKCSHHK